MYPAITQVTPHEDYKLTVVFENGEYGQLDVEPLLDFGVFQRLRDHQAFRRVRVAFDTIEWECGVDLDPEYVYKSVRPIRQVAVMDMPRLAASAALK